MISLQPLTSEFASFYRRSANEFTPYISVKPLERNDIFPLFFNFHSAPCIHLVTAQAQVKMEGILVLFLLLKPHWSPWAVHPLSFAFLAKINLCAIPLACNPWFSTRPTVLVYLDGYNNIFSTGWLLYLIVLELGRSKIKASATLVSGIGPLSRSQMVTSHCVLTFLNGKGSSLESPS